MPGLILAGAADDTGNLGVTALNRSSIAAIRAAAPDVALRVLDFGDGQGVVHKPIGESMVEWTRHGYRSGRRYWKTDNLATMTLGQRFGLELGLVRHFDEADALLDIGGGDSFADLYGAERFRLVADLRQLALRAGLPLVLLPQTYGPFVDPEIRAEAKEIVVGSRMAWARDVDSFAALQELVGADFDPERHRQGVDVAFGLPPRPVTDGPAAELVAAAPDGVVGLNVNGLIYNDPGARARYGHVLDYPAAVRALVGRLLDEGVPQIVLVPHVLADVGSLERDRTACERVVEHFDHDPRLVIAPDLDADEVKWLIGQLDWFCGTRMHATIAALSMGVPCATIAYSLKAKGVFESCDAGDAVADARHHELDETLSIVLASWQARDENRPVIAAAAARLRASAMDQMRTTMADLGIV